MTFKLVKTKKIILIDPQALIMLHYCVLKIKVIQIKSISEAEG